MAIFIWPLIATLVCCQNLATIAYAQDVNPCDVYDKDFQCEPSTENPFLYEDDPGCGTDLVQTTLRLFAEGDAVIDKQLEEFGNSTEAVLLIGNTGTGKSTLTYFLAGNNSAMISYQTGQKKYSIMDCNGKIGGSGIISQTTFPELVTDPITQTSIYDYPGFFDTRAVCVEIANAYYMLKVARNIPKTKFILVADHPSVGGRDRDSLVKLLKSVVNFIPNIEKFGSNLGLVATKVNEPSSLDEEFIPWIEDFRNETKNELPTVLEGDVLRKATFILDTLLVKGKLGVFRTPDDCGPLDTIPLMQTNKRNLYEIINTNLSYLDTEPDDFGVSLSSEALFTITNLRTRIAADIFNVLQRLSDEVFYNLQGQFECQGSNSCDVLLKNLQNLYNDQYYYDGYSTPSLYTNTSTTKMVLDITSVFYSFVDNEIFENISKSLNDSGKYLEFLQTLDNVEVDIFPLLVPLKDLKPQIAQTFTSLNTAFSTQVKQSLYTFTQELIDFFNDGFKCLGQSDCDTLLVSLIELYTNTDFLSGYAMDESWSQLSLVGVVNRVTDVLVSEFEVSEDVLASLQTYSKYLDDLHSLESFLTVDIDSWLNPFQTMTTTLKLNVRSFSSKVEQALTATVLNYSTELEENIFAKFNCFESMKCDNLFLNLHDLYQHPDFVSGYKNDGSWERLTPVELVSRVTNLSLTEYQTSPAISESLEKHSDYLDHLLDIDSSISMDREKWFESLQTFKANIQAKIVSLNTDLPSRITQDLTLFTAELISFFDTKFKCLEQSECSSLLNSLASLYSNSDFLKNYANDGSWGTLQYSNIVSRLTSTGVSEFQLSLKISESLKHFSNYLDEIHSIESLSAVNIEIWLYPFRSMKTTVKTNVGSFKTSVEQALTTTLTSYSTDLGDNIFVKFNCFETMKCDSLLQNLNVLYKNSDFVGGYKNDGTWDSLTSQELTSRMTDLNLTDYETNPDISASLEKQSDYIDSILKIDSTISVENERWFESLRKLEPNLTVLIQTTVKEQVSQMIIKSMNEIYMRAFSIASKKFNSFGDIILKKKEIETYLALVVSKIDTLSFKLKDNLSIYQFTEAAIATFIELGCSASDEGFVAIRAQKPFFDLLEAAKISTIIKESEQSYWLNPFTLLKGLIENEETWCDFLRNVFAGLSEKAYQIDDKKYIIWWTSNRPIHTNDINNQKLKDFWTYFSAISAFIGLSYTKALELLKQDSVNKITSLNLLLDTTLLPTLDCKTSANKVCNCNGIYVSLKEVNSRCKPNAPTQLVVSAYHSLFIDGGIVGSEYSATNNLDIILVSPNAWNNDQYALNLNGVPGAAQSPVGGTGNEPGLAGNPGGKGGNFYSIVEKYNSPITVVSVEGGKGGKGQVGQRGLDGQNGGIKELSWNKDNDIIPEIQCAAWLGGTVYLQSDFQPNTCDDPRDDDDDHPERCNAGDKGVTYEVPGHKGTSGNPGGHGGKAGLGGYGGTIYIEFANKNLFNNLTKSERLIVPGSDGSKGEIGEGGQGGVGGNTGDTYKIKVDDVQSSGKRCKRLSNSTIPVNDHASGGSSGTAGGSNKDPDNPTRQTFDPSTIISSIIDNFITASEFLKSNEFFKSSITAFHSKLSSVTF